jgi:hypothetical protein
MTLQPRAPRSWTYEPSNCLRRSRAFWNRRRQSVSQFRRRAGPTQVRRRTLRPWVVGPLRQDSRDGLGAVARCRPATVIPRHPPAAVKDSDGGGRVPRPPRPRWHARPPCQCSGLPWSRCRGLEVREVGGPGHLIITVREARDLPPPRRPASCAGLALLVPAGACWCLVVPCGALWRLVVPCGAWCLVVPCGALRCLVVPCGAL